MGKLDGKVALCDLNLKIYKEFEFDAKAMTGESTYSEGQPAMDHSVPVLTVVGGSR